MLSSKAGSTLLGLAVLVGVAAAAAPALAQSGSNTISVPVGGLQGNEGNVRCGLYDSAATFRKPGEEKLGVVAPIRNRKATCVFAKVPPGNYAVAVFHAAAGETAITYGLFGKPQQGYGFSRNPASLFGPPAFGAAAFDYDGGAVTMPVTLTY